MTHQLNDVDWCEELVSLPVIVVQYSATLLYMSVLGAVYLFLGL